MQVYIDIFPARPNVWLYCRRTRKLIFDPYAVFTTRATSTASSSICQCDPMILIHTLRAFSRNTIKRQRHPFNLPLAGWFHNGPSTLYRAGDGVGALQSNLLPKLNYILACQGITPETHTMGDSLHRYLAMKIHPLVDCSEWTNLVVVGQHSRVHDPEAVVSSKEKRDKLFNWMRPTAKHVGADLHIQCFPGADHVKHYAALLATYLRISRGNEAALKVFYEVVGNERTISTLESGTNILQMPRVDVVVIGLVHRLGDLTSSSPFIGSRDDEFAWVVKRFGKSGKMVAFLGCRFSFWGSIGGDLVRVVAKHTGAKQLIYFGKLGTTRPSVQPNRYLASGDSSWVPDAGVVQWKNILAPALNAATKIPLVLGKHETLPSVLFETNEWLAKANARGHDFVDPEVGQMALAAVETGLEFGYLHVISDNVAQKYDEDLSNERLKGVLHGRDQLYKMVNQLLGKHLDSM